MDGDTELGFAEFVMFIVVVKQIEERCRNDEEFSKTNFPSFKVKLQARVHACDQLEICARVVLCPARHHSLASFSSSCMTPNSFLGMIVIAAQPFDTPPLLF